MFGIKKFKLSEIENFLLDLSVHLKLDHEPDITYQQKLYSAFWFIKNTEKIFKKRRKEEIDGLKWRIVMLEEKLNNGRKQ